MELNATLYLFIWYLLFAIKRHSIKFIYKFNAMTNLFINSMIIVDVTIAIVHDSINIKNMFYVLAGKLLTTF